MMTKEQGHEQRPALRRLRDLLVRPNLSFAHVLIVALCLAVGVGLVAQVRQTQDDSFESMRQDDLVRLLDELSSRNVRLEQEEAALRQELADLQSGSDSRVSAHEAAEQQAQERGILAGTLPVAGPGIELVVTDEQGEVTASTFVNVLEELRNAGTEAVALNGQRITASSWIVTASGSLVVSGAEIKPPYRWQAIGDPQTLAVALDIPGGALASIRATGAEVDVVQRDRLEISSVRSVTDPEHASPVPADES